MESSRKYRFQIDHDIKRVPIALPSNLNLRQKIIQFEQCLKIKNLKLWKLMFDPDPENLSCPGHCDQVFESLDDYIPHIAEIYQTMVKCLLCKELSSFCDIDEDHQCFLKKEILKKGTMFFDHTEGEYTVWTGNETEFNEVNDQIMGIIKYLNRFHPGEILNMEIYIGFTTIPFHRRISQHRRFFTIYSLSEADNNWANKNHMLRYGKNMVQAEMDIVSHTLLDLHKRRSLLDDGRENINGVIPRLANTQFKFETQHETKDAMIYIILRKKENEDSVDYKDIWFKGLENSLIPKLASWYADYKLKIIDCLKIVEKDFEQYGENFIWAPVIVRELNKLIITEYKIRKYPLEFY